MIPPFRFGIQVKDYCHLQRWYVNMSTLFQGTESSPRFLSRTKLHVITTEATLRASCFCESELTELAASFFVKSQVSNLDQVLSSHWHLSSKPSMGLCRTQYFEVDPISQNPTRKSETTLNTWNRVVGISASCRFCGVGFLDMEELRRLKETPLHSRDE